MYRKPLDAQLFDDPALPLLSNSSCTNLQLHSQILSGPKNRASQAGGLTVECWNHFVDRNLKKVVQCADICDAFVDLGL